VTVVTRADSPTCPIEIKVSVEKAERVVNTKRERDHDAADVPVIYKRVKCGESASTGSNRWSSISEDTQESESERQTLVEEGNQPSETIPTEEIRANEKLSNGDHVDTTEDDDPPIVPPNTSGRHRRLMRLETVSMGNQMIAFRDSPPARREKLSPSRIRTSGQESPQRLSLSRQPGRTRRSRK